MTSARLLSRQGADALRMAAQLGDPTSLQAATALRKHFDAELAAAALSQTSLRARAAKKFGDRAASMLFTSDALEQATRPAVARWRAQRLLDAGVDRVIDLGCGIGADAIGFASAGLGVTAVERDETTAAYARHNLTVLDQQGTAARSEVVCGDATTLLHDLLAGHDSRTAVFCDPARRTERGRTWRVEQFTPEWKFVLGLLQLQQHPAVVKLGPGVPKELIPGNVETCWVSDHGAVVEAGLWRLVNGADGAVGNKTRRAAHLLPGGHHLADTDQRKPLHVGGVGAHLLEPDGAIIRAGLFPQLAAVLDGDCWLLDPQLAYLSSEQPGPSVLVTSFRVNEVLDPSEKSLRAWVRERDIGVLEIKKRGVDVDPAVLRRRLKPTGTQSATLILTRTPDGVRAIVGTRVLPEPAIGAAV